MRTSFLPFHCPDITDSDIDAVARTMRSGWLTTGPQSEQFEKEFADYVGASHAVSVNSGTAALHLALEAIGVGNGDEVIVPTMTFAATAEVVEYNGAIPILVDCLPDRLTIDPTATANAVTPRTKAIIPMHYGGHPCDMDALLELADAHAIHVIEDAAHALPTSFRGQTIGSLSEFTCFSFYATKTITSGEGGMITTENDDRAHRLRQMRLHGIDHAPEHGAPWQYQIASKGFKYNLSDILAALGLSQLRRCDSMWRRRSAIANTYDKSFRDISAIGVPARTTHAEPSWHLYSLRLTHDQLAISRDEFIQQLATAQIGTSVHYRPLHQHPKYAQNSRYSSAHFPHADQAFQDILSLPIYSAMTDQDVADVVDAVISTVRQHTR